MSAQPHTDHCDETRMRWPQPGESMYHYAKHMERVLIARGWVVPAGSPAIREEQP